MKKKFALLVVLLLLVLALVGCSSTQASTAAANTGNTAQSAAATTPQPGQANTTQNPGGPGGSVDDKLAYGILKLESTDQAVTAEQAKALLPLWKAMKSLSSSATASQDEISAVYTQIKESMTAEQVQAITDLSLSPEDQQALMTQYNITAPSMGDMPAVSDDQRATRQAQFQAQGGSDTGGRGGGDMAGGDMGGGQPPDASGGQMPAGGQDGSGSQPQMQGTPGARPAGGTAGGMRGMNTLWLDAVIQVLTERAG
jgi:hypothetical protein